MMKPVTKYTTTIVSGERIPYILENAFRIAEDEKPGAVHIEFPEDIAAVEVPDKYSITDLGTRKIRRPVPDYKAIPELIAELEQSKAPIILIGSGANRKRITTYLTKFIEKYNIPYFTSQMGKGVVS
jgi:acetolactate synthase-1/2/3 large subunit